MKKYVVKQGDCLSSIGARFGFFPEVLWDLPENAELKNLRKDPNVLCPKDIIYIPDKRQKTETAAADQKHRFRKKNTPAVLRLQLLDSEDKPRAGINYVLDLGGRLINGTTDGDGKLEESIPSDTKTASLTLENEDVIPLELGALDPIDMVSGVKERLLNLGYECGSINEQIDDEAEEALKEFQAEHDLEETGQIDQATKDKLLEIHGS